MSCERAKNPACGEPCLWNPRNLIIKQLMKKLSLNFEWTPDWLWFVWRVIRKIVGPTLLAAYEVRSSIFTRLYSLKFLVPWYEWCFECSKVAGERWCGPPGGFWCWYWGGYSARQSPCTSSGGYPWCFFETRIHETEYKLYQEVLNQFGSSTEIREAIDRKNIFDCSRWRTF